MIQISGGIWSKFICMIHKSIKWRGHPLSFIIKNIKCRGHPLPSMAFDNPWFCSMVWVQGTLYLSHPWYFTTHGFDPWYCPEAHCNNFIKRLYAFSIKHWRIFDILHFFHSIELLGFWLWALFLIWFERWGSKNRLWASPLQVAYIRYVSLSKIFIS